MAKRLSENQKGEIIRDFLDGKSIDALSKKFRFTKLTIIRNLKKNLGELKYKKLIDTFNFSDKKSSNNKKLVKPDDKNNENHYSFQNNSTITLKDDEFLQETPFVEFVPLAFDFDNTPQKELSSIPISDVNFPSIVYMIVDKKIELETKFLKDYPEWQFLPVNELERETIEIYDDLQIAKKFCNREKKVIKIPNSSVLKIVAPILLSRGISRIISSKQLIAL